MNLPWAPKENSLDVPGRSILHYSWHRRLSVKFAKFLRTSVLSNPSGRNLSKISNWDRCSRTSLIDAWDSFCKTYVSKAIQDTCQWKPTTLGQPKFNFINAQFFGRAFFRPRQIWHAINECTADRIWTRKKWGHCTIFSTIFSKELDQERTTNIAPDSALCSKT